MSVRHFLLTLPLLVACHDTGLERRAADCAAHTTYADCASDAECEAITCPACYPDTRLVGCFARGTGPAVTCDLPDCEHACNEYPDEQSCDANPSCASIFESNPDDCAGGCSLFIRCGDRGVACYQAPPSGNACLTGVDCDEGYLYLIDDGGCTSGCMRPGDCTEPLD